MNKDIISLRIPAKSEYLSVVRLAIAGLSYNLEFNIEDIEDLKVAVAEACINVVKIGKNNEVSIEFEVKENCIHTKIKDVKKPSEEDAIGFEGANLSLLIIESLMDEVKFTEWGLEMVKFVGADSHDNG